jgi:hypothetical protein
VCKRVCVPVCVLWVCVKRSNVSVMSLCIVVRPLFPWSNESIAKRLIRPEQDDGRGQTYPTDA